ncbi:tyrosine-type recombinase/integrase [Spirillospora sp. CA-128828]|uniref:tyrosine-type recombinase/integrase n=1 Tax=Spirillospora sp. CA-128828 TaxID=3240033 RepID=UPI003D8CEE1C
MTTDEELISAYLRYLVLQGRSDNTRRVYRGRLVELARLLGSGLLQATPDDIATWRAGLTVADPSVLCYAAAVKGFYAWAHSHGHIPANPAMHIPLPRQRQRLPRPISDADLEAAIDQAPARIRPWLVLAGYAGLRCCEIARLRRDGIVDTASGPALLVLGKGDKERLIPMSPYVWDHLQAAGLPRHGWVFLRRDGRPGHVPVGTVTADGNAHLRACGIRATMHQLRHRFGTSAYASSKDIRVVQELMGHSSPATTALYAAHSNADAVSAVAAIQPSETGRGARPVAGRRVS